MITHEQQKYKKFLSIIAVIMLLLAIPSIWPYGYFQILKFVITGIACFNAYIAHKLNRKIWFWAMIILIILFNPIAPIYFDKETWIVIDLIAAFTFFVFINKVK